ncbi:hypothetical protein C100_16340 [Sphingobium sp. C100]|nr:hypothetical protein C100_16340 [Sphingobium sp. C100]
MKSIRMMTNQALMVNLHKNLYRAISDLVG